MNKVTLIYHVLSLAILSSLLHSANALAINKCTHNGDVTYTDSPCPEGNRSSPLTSQIIPPNDPAAAKQRYLSDQQELNKINKQKIKEEKQQRHEAEKLALQMKKNDEHAYKCKELDFKKKSAQQNLAEVQVKKNGKATIKAQAKHKQATDKYAHYCSSGE